MEKAEDFETLILIGGFVVIAIIYMIALLINQYDKNR